MRRDSLLPHAPTRSEFCPRRRTSNQDIDCSRRPTGRCKPHWYEAAMLDLDCSLMLPSSPRAIGSVPSDPLALRLEERKHTPGQIRCVLEFHLSSGLEEPRVDLSRCRTSWET